MVAVITGVASVITQRNSRKAILDELAILKEMRQTLNEPELLASTKESIRRQVKYLTDIDRPTRAFIVTVLFSMGGLCVITLMVQSAVTRLELSWAESFTEVANEVVVWGVLIMGCVVAAFFGYTLIFWIPAALRRHWRRFTDWRRSKRELKAAKKSTPVDVP